MNYLPNVYKDAAGLWYEDRLCPLIVAMLKLAMNLLWVKLVGIDGVLMLTVASMVLVGIQWILKNLFVLLVDRHLLKENLL